MGVLHVVDGILAARLDGQIEIDVERLVVRALDQEVAGGVDTNRVRQLGQRDDVAPALAHALARDRDQLVDQALDVLRVVAETLCAGLEALDVAMVICAQHVDSVGRTALELEVHVREVGGKIGVLAIGLQ